MIVETTASNEAESLKSNWKSIDESRSQIAKQVFQLATALSGTKRRQLNSIGQWFDGSGDYEAALERPDVLCFCLPWLEAMLSKQTQGPSLTEVESVAAIGKGFCKFESNAPAGVNLIPFLYPLIAFLAWLAMVTFGSIFILPEFRRMFEEFGIELPATTKGVLNIGSWVEANWIPCYAILLICLAVFMAVLQFSQRGSAYSLSWLDRFCCRFRIKLSVWANHMASLLSAGVSEMEAIQIAGRCSASRLLRDSCINFVSNDDTDLVNPLQYPLINNSLSLKNRSAKIAILEETGRYYRLVGHVVRGWWLSWLSKAIVFLIFATVVVVMLSVFSPLMSLGSGLMW